MVLALAQAASARGFDPHLDISLGALTPGNVLILQMARHDGPAFTYNQLVGPTFTAIDTYRLAQATGMRMYYRVIQPGDSSSFEWQTDDYYSAVLSEFSGLDPAASPSVLAASDNNNNDALALAVSPGAGVPVFAGFVTRDEDSGSFTPNGSSLTPLGGDHFTPGIASATFVYGTGNITLGGTNSYGGGRGEWWGGAAFSWPLGTHPRAFSPGLIG